MDILVIAVVGSLVVAAFASLAEAALYAVPLPYVKYMAAQGSRAGEILLEFKTDMGKPISTILIFSTIANTAGGAVCGWAVTQAFGPTAIVPFSIVFTLAVLMIGEIIPKTLGVQYSKTVSALIAIPLSVIGTIVSPVVWVTNFLSRMLEDEEGSQDLSHQEVLSMATMGVDEGALDHFEGSVIENVIELDELLVRDVLTPRVVVFRKPEDITAGELDSEIGEWTFSRVPLHPPGNSDLLTSYITQRDVYELLRKGQPNTRLSEIGRPLTTVPELMRVDKLLLQMFEEREQICAVIDEHGSLAGIITVEDILEEIVGREIVDEYDKVSNLRTFAEIREMKRSRAEQRKSKRSS